MTSMRSGPSRLAGMVVTPQPRELTQPALLAPRHRLEGGPVAVAAARLDLAHDEIADVAGHDVDLAPHAPPVAVEDRQALAAQVAAGEPLAVVTEEARRGAPARVLSHRSSGPCHHPRALERPAETRPQVCGRHTDETSRAGRCGRTRQENSPVSGSLMSGLGSSSTLTSLNVTTRTFLTKRAGR